MNEHGGRRRSRQIQIRVTPEEWREIRAMYERTLEHDVHQRRMTFTAWASQMLRCGHVDQIVVAIDPSTLRKAIGEIGNNINQIAHVANATQSVSEHQTRLLVEQFAQLRDIFLRLSEDHDQIVAARDGGARR